MKKSYIFSLLIFIVLGTAFLYKKNLEAEKVPQILPKDFSIEAIKVKKGLFEYYSWFTGEIKPINCLTINSELDGVVIKKLNFQEGFKVKKNDVLLLFERTKYEIKLEAAIAQLKNKETQYKRLQVLVKNSYISKSDLEKAEVEYELARNEYKTADYQLAKTKILAPFSGKISLHSLSVGKMVNSNEKLFTLVDNSAFYVLFRVGENDLRYLNIGKEVVVKLGEDNLKIPAAIENIDIISDNLSHTVLVKALLKKVPDYLRGGMFAKVKVNLQNEENALLIPESAVVKIGCKDYVFKIEKADDKFFCVQTEINTVDRKKGVLVINSGLQENDIIAFNPSNLRDGRVVKITNKEGEEITEDQIVYGV